MRKGWIGAGLIGLLAGAAALTVTLMDEEPEEVSSPVAWEWSVVVDSGGGFVGPWRMNRSVWRYVDDPAVALDTSGRAAVAWVDQSRKDVLFRRYGPDGEPLLEEPVNVSRSPDVFSWLPRVVTSVDGEEIYLLWQEIVFSGGTHGGEAFFARSTDGGRSFGEPVNLSNTAAGAGKGRMSPDRWHNGSLDLAPGPEGELIAVWTVYEGGLFASRSGDGGTSFSAPVRVTGGGRHEPARAPSVAVGPEGAVHLAWAVGQEASADLRYATSADGGRSYGETRVLFEGDGQADAPELAVFADGALHLAWHESPAGVVGADRILYARSPGPGARSASDPGPGPGSDAGPASGPDPGFAPPVEVAAPGADHAAFRFPSLALDGQGDPLLLWELYAEGSEHPRGLGLALSTDGGRSFAGWSTVPGTGEPAFTLNGSLQGRLTAKLAVNPEGEVAVVNSGFEPLSASRILLVHGRVPR